MSDATYNTDERFMAAMRRSGTAYAHERVSELLAERPSMSAAELVDVLREEAEQAAAELARWDAMK